jgi:5-methyltetrahydropteroyltriglutamate--homocysteine methyltransferase
VIAANNGGYPWSGTPLGAALAASGQRQRPGEAPDAELRALMDQATREAIDAQAAAGLDLMTDGHVRRSDPVSPVISRLEGMQIANATTRYPGKGMEIPVPIAAGEIAWREPILVEDYLFASHGSTRPLMVVLPGPYTLAHLSEDRAYGDPSALAMALAIALNQELKALQAAGATFLQIDEPGLLERRAEFPIFTRVWEVLGRGISATLSLRLEGGGIEQLYPGIARLKRLGCLSLDAVAGQESLVLLESSPWPEPLRLGLGVVDGSSESVESAEEIAARVQSFRGLPPQDRIILGPASDLDSLPHDAASGKLRSLARAARMLEG